MLDIRYRYSFLHILDVIMCCMMNILFKEIKVN